MYPAMARAVLAFWHTGVSCTPSHVSIHKRLIQGYLLVNGYQVRLDCPAKDGSRMGSIGRHRYRARVVIRRTESHENRGGRNSHHGGVMEGIYVYGGYYFVLRTSCSIQSGTARVSLVDRTLAFASLFGRPMRRILRYPVPSV